MKIEHKSTYIITGLSVQREEAGDDVGGGRMKENGATWHGSSCASDRRVNPPLP